MAGLKGTIGLVCGAFLATTGQAQSVFLVENGADQGDGSLRAALMQAEQSEQPALIIVRGDQPIQISSPLTYAGQAPLAIYGRGQSIASNGNFTLLEISQGADLYLRNLGFSGPGGFDVENRVASDTPAGKGVFVGTRPDQSDVIRVTLENVRIADVAGHGLHISDCLDPLDCDDGSEASILLHIQDSEFVNIGHGRHDSDGVRVDERGPGDIMFAAISARFADSGADGVELDERQRGDVDARLSNTTFESNGYYCNPDVLFNYLPAVTESEFEQGMMPVAELQSLFSKSPDPDCIELELETHADGTVSWYEASLDVDDGFDIDEAGKGDVRVVVEGSALVGNYSEALDLDESGAGHVSLTVIGTLARDNDGDAFKVDEAKKGDVVASFVDVLAEGNGGIGVLIEEEDDGDARVQASYLRTLFNAKLGLELIQSDDGLGELTLRDSALQEGFETEGVQLRD